MLRKLVIRIAVWLIAFAVGVTATQLVSVTPLKVARKAGDGHARLVSPRVLPAAAVPQAEPKVEWEPPQSPSPIARIIETGDFHGDEVSARTGERWLGLYVTNKGSFLADSAVTVTAFKDIVDDDKSTEKTGKRVSVSRRPNPVLLIEGASTLRPGPVSTVFAGRMTLSNTTSLDLSLGATSYGLNVKTKDTNYSFSVHQNDAKLILNRNSEHEQVLYDLGGTGEEIEGNWELLWAGDMDGDNKLDLYVRVGWHYNSSQRKLFLSSYARKGKLVREVGEFSTSGC